MEMQNELKRVYEMLTPEQLNELNKWAQTASESEVSKNAYLARQLEEKRGR
jgi:Spy/CpxP family protein refolding chaperone